MDITRKIATIFNRILDVLFILSTAVLVLISLTILVEVGMRTFFARPITGTVEITGYCLVAVTFLGAAWLLREDGHTRMDLVLSRLKPRAKTILNGVTSVIGAITCIIIAWYGWRATWYSYQTNYFAFSELEVPMYPITSIISLGMFLLFIQFLRSAYGYLRCELRERTGETRI